MINLTAILTIAKKEFSDKLYESSLVLLMAIFMLALFIYTYGADFGDVAKVIGVFFPLIGIVLGYDAIIREKNSKSLNVLLTQPVFRDNIITGKFVGISLTLFLVIFVSLMIILASDYMIYGQVAQLESFFRLLLFGIFAYFYLLIFASLGLLTSIILKSEIMSLTLGVIVWLTMCFALGPSIIMLTSIITGQSMFEMTDEFLATGSSLFNISPIHHFAEVTVGSLDLSYGSFSIQREVHGFLDTRYSILYLLEYYWQNVVVLVAVPIILLIVSYISFLREDI
jgi:ABC-type transport system involved in multi-copper enzyme maturation permease subunit